MTKEKQVEQYLDADDADRVSEVRSDELLERLRKYHPERDPQKGGKG